MSAVNLTHRCAHRPCHRKDVERFATGSFRATGPTSWRLRLWACPRHRAAMVDALDGAFMARSNDYTTATREVFAGVAS